MKPIPISAAEKIAKQYGYDQVIILGRVVTVSDNPGGEHMTTYGRNRVHCRIAARAGKYLQQHVLGWHDDQETTEA